MGRCVEHFDACKCRERYFRDLATENHILKARLAKKDLVIRDYHLILVDLANEARTPDARAACLRVLSKIKKALKYNAHGL